MTSTPSFRTRRRRDPKCRQTFGSCISIPGSRASLAPGNDLSRREFIALAAGAAASSVSWPFTARAQQAGKVWRVGMLDTVPVALNAKNIDAFRAAMRALGYLEGRKTWSSTTVRPKAAPSACRSLLLS